MHHLPINDNYYLCEKIGGGGFGKVYSVFDSDTGQYIAFKDQVVGPVATKELEMFEKFQWSQFCPPFHRSFEYMDMQGQMRCVTMLQLLDYDLWFLRVKKCGGRFSLGTATNLCLQGVEAVQDFHSTGNVHCDITPGNFMIGKDGHLYLIDYGSARPFKQDPWSTGLAHFTGTPRYASPNAHNYSQVLSPRDDLWSLAYMYVEMITGVLPWAGRTEPVAGLMKSLYDTGRFTVPLPGQMYGFIDHISKLGVDETPKYKYLSRCLRDILRENNVERNAAFDWELKDRSNLLYWPLPPNNW